MHNLYWDYSAAAPALSVSDPDGPLNPASTLFLASSQVARFCFGYGRCAGVYDEDSLASACYSDGTHPSATTPIRTIFLSCLASAPGGVPLLEIPLG